MSTIFEEERVPELRENEVVQTVSAAKTDGVVQTETKVCVTNQRVIVFKEQSDSIGANSPVRIKTEIPLHRIIRMWEKATDVAKEVYLDTENERYQLPDLYSDTEHVTRAIAAQTDLVQKEWLQEMQEAGTVKEKLHIILNYARIGSGLIELWAGVLLLFTGIITSLSFYGIYVGIFFYFLGFALIARGIQALVGTSSHVTKREWVILEQ